MTVFRITKRQVLVINGDQYQFLKERKVGRHLVRDFEHKTLKTVRTVTHDAEVVRCAGGWKIKEGKYIPNLVKNH